MHGAVDIFSVSQRKEIQSNIITGMKRNLLLLRMRLDSESQIQTL